MSTPCADLLEDWGLSETEWEVLLLIYKRTNCLGTTLAGWAKMRPSEFRRHCDSLLSLGYIGAKKNKDDFHYRPSAKGNEAIRTIKSESGQGVPEPEQVEELTESQGEALTALLEIALHTEFNAVNSGLTPTWVAILSVLRGVGHPLTVPEIHSHIACPLDLFPLKKLESMVDKRVPECPKAMKRIGKRFQYLEATCRDPLMVTLSEVGKEAISDAMEDLESRA